LKVVVSEIKIMNMWNVSVFNGYNNLKQAIKGESPVQPRRNRKKVILSTNKKKSGVPSSNILIHKINR
jgi:hypothetical protein